MRWRAFQVTDKTKWHAWFAWYPVKIGKTRVWLERVQRMIEYDREGWSCYYDWLPGDSPEERLERERSSTYPLR